MLKKLIKYDMKATARNFGVLYIVVMALAILSAILNAVCSSFPVNDAFNPLHVMQGILGVLYGISLFGVNFFTIIICMRFFYDNLFKDEGYLMHTLPVTPAKLIWSKVITSAIWGIATAVLSILSLLVVGGEMGRINPRWSDFDFSQFLQHPAYISVALMAILTAVVGVVFIELWICASLSIGSLLAKYHRAVCVGMLIAFGVVHVIIIICIMAAGENVPQSSWIFQLGRTLASSGEDGGYVAANIVMACVSAYMALFSLIYFVITQAIMKNHLNLE